MTDLIIQSKVRDFRVKFTNNFDFVDSFLKIPNYIVVVGDVVFRTYKNKLFKKFPKENLLVVKLGEERKTLETSIKIYNQLLNKAAKKNMVIISFGGGINQDVVGFTASTLYRGVDWIYVPTTLLAMADSAIGLKTSLNINNYKNVLGTFYPPQEIYINANFLRTLKKKDYYSGVGEISKFLLMQPGASRKINQSAKELKILTEFKNSKQIIDIVKKSIKVKQGYMKGDEFDTGRRNLLNYGHELGHALESTSHFEIPHGIAVMIGMLFANIVSLNRKYISEKLFNEINEKILLPNIPFAEFKMKRKYFDSKSLLNRLKKDKKRVSVGLPLVLPKKNLELIKITDFTPSEFNQNLKEMLRILREKIVLN